MNIVAHTSNHLTLQDPKEQIWIARLIAGIFLVWGSWDLGMAIIDLSFLSVLIVIHITFFLGLGTALALFPCQTTVHFDKSSNHLIINYESPLRTKTIEYSLDEIIDLIIEEDRSSQGMKYALFLLLASQSQKIPLSRIEMSQSAKVEEIATVIRTFLDIPL